MVTMDYRQMLVVSLWQYNHHASEGLTLPLFQETFGESCGQHYYEKWTLYFNRNLWDMLVPISGARRKTGRNSVTWWHGR